MQGLKFPNFCLFLKNGPSKLTQFLGIFDSYSRNSPKKSAHGPDFYPAADCRFNIPKCSVWFHLAVGTGSSVSWALKMWSENRPFCTLCLSLYISPIFQPISTVFPLYGGHIQLCAMPYRDLALHLPFLA